jgi:hypothetical protein
VSNAPQAQKSFWMHLMALQGCEARCTVCVECTFGSEIILDAPDVTPS